MRIENVLIQTQARPKHALHATSFKIGMTLKVMTLLTLHPPSDAKRCHETDVPV